MTEGGGNPLHVTPITNSSDEILEMSQELASLRVFREPLCLIRNAADGIFSIDEEVLKQISKIDKTVNVIAIAGPYRTGKSYLMNRLARNIHAFRLGNGVDAETKGVWVWCLMHPVYSDQVMVLLDTEGIGDAKKSNSENDYKLLCITTLICSTFIYNLKGVITIDTLDRLGFVTYYAEKILGSEEKPQNACTTDLGLYFPNFVLCLRDFSHDLGDDTPNDYLESHLRLKENPSQEPETERYNLIRACIQKFFLRRECFVFDIPVAGRKKLVHLETTEESNLLDSFREDSDLFKNKITEYKPKELFDGRRINGRNIDKIWKECFDENIQRQRIICISAMEKMYDQEMKNKLIKGCYRNEDGYFNYKKDRHDLETKIKETLPEMDGTLFETFCKEFRNKHIKDDMFDMEIADQIKKQIADEHNKEMQKIEDEFQRRLNEEQCKRQKMEDENRRLLSIAEEQKEKLKQERVQEWKKEDEEVFKKLQKEEKRVKDLLSLLKTEIDESEHTNLQILAQVGSSMLPVIGPMFYGVHQKMKQRDRKKELRKKMDEFMDSGEENDTAI